MKERRWSNVIFKGDAQTVVKALQHNLPRGLHNQVLFNNIFDILSDVNSYSFSFCFREANNVAHRLARWAMASVCSRV